MKKSLIIIFTVIIIISVGAGVYFAWKKSKEILEPPAVNLPAVDYNLPLATSTAPKLTALTDQPVFGYWLSIATSSPEAEIFYLNQNGLILKAKDGDDEIISDREIKNLRTYEANAKRSKVLVRSGFLTASVFEIFNLETKVWQLLENVFVAAFSPDGTKIAYLDANNNLIVKNLTDKKQKTEKIMSFNQTDFDLKWPVADKILLVSRPSASVRGEIWEANVKKKTLRLFADGNGLTVNWSKDGALGLKFSVNQKNEIKLNLIDAEGAIKADLGFSTLADKCLINLAKIYCAVPKNYNSVKEPVLPDDYLKRAVYSDDAIYEIDLTENSSKKILDENRLAIDAVNFSLSGNRLFFVNRYDNKLYGFDL
ncbi:hypothetical protein HZB06_00805 [Candidatus Wolfebacteria bacterium]|nr:hypothetical protein [Candidatus Wolfebacteria bacterium]